MTASVDTALAEATKPEKKIESFEDILPHIGGAGRYQWFLFFLLLPFTASYAFLYFTQLFLTLTSEDHWCRVPELDASNLTDWQKIALSIPDAVTDRASPASARKYSRCEMYIANYTQELISGTKVANASWPKKSCTDGWQFNNTNIPYASIAAEFGWVCDKTHYASTAQSIFYVGSILGGFVFGYVADHYGRLPSLVACNAVGFFASIGTAFCNSFWTFCLCRFVAGTAYDNCFNILLIIVIEYVSPEYRTFMANMSFGVYFSFTAGILPWLAYYIADWRMLSIASAMPLTMGFAAPWLVPESARWYISNGNIPKAIKVIKKFERINGKTVEPKIYEEFEQSCNEIAKTDHTQNYTVLDLFKKPRLAYITIMLVLYWLFILIIYDGHVWTMKSLDPDVFTSFSLGVVSEFPAAILLTLFLDRWGRRWMGFFCMMVCGVFSLLALATPPGSATVAMGVLARFGINIAGNIGFQYAAELLPTVVRGQGVSLIHIIGYVAHIIGPYIVYLSDISASVPLTVLGLLSICVAVQALFMPETLGQNLPGTLEEGNDFGRGQRFWWVPCVSRTLTRKNSRANRNDRDGGWRHCQSKRAEPCESPVA